MYEPKNFLDISAWEFQQQFLYRHLEEEHESKSNDERPDTGGIQPVSKADLNIIWTWFDESFNMIWSYVILWWYSDVGRATKSGSLGTANFWKNYLLCICIGKRYLLCVWIASGLKAPCDLCHLQKKGIALVEMQSHLEKAKIVSWLTSTQNREKITDYRKEAQPLSWHSSEALVVVLEHCVLAPP